MPNQVQVKAVRETPKGKYIAAVISPCYGGYGVSKFAMGLYHKRYKKAYGKKFEGSPFHIIREDSILVDLVEEFPEKVSGEHAKLEVVFYHSKYDGFFEVGDYDGYENGYIDVSAFKLHTIGTIAESSIEAEEKVKEIAAIVKDACLDAEVISQLPTENENDSEPVTEDK